MKHFKNFYDQTMLFMEIILLSNISIFGLRAYAEDLTQEYPSFEKAPIEEEFHLEPRDSLQDFFDYSNEQEQREQQQYQQEQEQEQPQYQQLRQHRRQYQNSEISTSNCLKQVLTRFHGIRILNATGMTHRVTPLNVDPLCIILPTTTTPGTTPTPIKSTIDFRGMTEKEDLIVFRLNRSGHDLKKVVITKAELKIFMIAKNESAKQEPKKHKRKQHKERFSISIHGLANGSFSILASMTVRISNSKWQKFLLSTSYVQNLVQLSVDKLILKISCENCEDRVELYKGPLLNKNHEVKKRNKNHKHQNQKVKESKRQAKRAPKLMLEVKEAI